VSGREAVAGIPARAEPLLMARGRDDRADLLGVRADGAARPGRVLQQHAHLGRGLARALESRIQPLSDARNPGLDSRTLVRARMQHRPPDAQPRATDQLIRQRGHGFLAQIVLGRGQVDEVGGVRKDVRQAEFLPGLGKGPGLLVAHGLGAPLPLVAGEYLHGLAAHAHDVPKRQMQPASRGHVRAQKRHGFSPRGRRANSRRER